MNFFKRIVDKWRAARGERRRKSEEDRWWREELRLQEIDARNRAAVVAAAEGKPDAEVPDPLPPAVARVEDVLDDGDADRAARRRARIADAMKNDAAARYMTPPGRRPG